MYIRKKKLMSDKLRRIYGVTILYKMPLRRPRHVVLSGSLYNLLGIYVTLQYNNYYK